MRNFDRSVRPLALAITCVSIAGVVAPNARAAGLPSAGNAFSPADTEALIRRAMFRARQLGVNATISVVDSEGNILGVVRMTDPALLADPATSTVTGGGRGGLEGVTLPSAITATSKAGTGAFLSTSLGNAFTTRTAGFIVQDHFPPGIEFQDSGPLFGVQFSSLPTSDFVRLPLGMSADPGGIPLHRAGEVVGGVGVELDGVYGVDRTPRARTIVLEEQIALAAQIGLAPPSDITADRIAVDGIRLAYQNGRAGSVPPPAALPSLGAEIAAGRAVALIPPRAGPTESKFVPSMAGTVPGRTLRNLTASRYEGVAVGEGSLFAVRARPDLTRELVRVGVPGGAITIVGSLTGPAANQLPTDDSVSALAYDDNQTIGAPADDRLVIFTGAGRVFTISPTGAGATPLVTLATPAARPRDAIVVSDSGASRVIGISAATGQVFKINVAAAATAAGFTALTEVSNGRAQSIAAGPAGVFAILATTTPVGSRDLVRLNLAGGFALVERLTDAGPNEIGPGQNVFSLAYDDLGTPDAGDDMLVAQNSTLARQFRIAAGGAGAGDIGAPPRALSDRRATLRQARTIASGADRFIVGISKQTGRLFALRAFNVTLAALSAELTPADPVGVARVGVAGPGGVERLSAADVERSLARAHELNSFLRAMIRRDSPRISRVNVAVVDYAGNLLGFFRNDDAPVFGADVAVQKARSALLFSRPDCGALLRAAEGGAFAPFADACAAIGLPLDGSLAISDRAIGFIARPTLPDGIPLTAPGPLGIRRPDRFSVFNTGLQTDLFVTNLVRFLAEFGAVGDEGLALDLFDSGVIGAGGAVDASLPLANGLQIFPGSVPLYKNGVLVGAIGVSGDGIEQDDFVSFAGSSGFRALPAATRTSDRATITVGGRSIRLPYIKMPRNPFGGR